MKKIYLDYASTTPVDKRVLREMLPYFLDKFENPSSIYLGGLIAFEAIDRSREKIAKFLNCKKEEIIFTSGGSESDNLAVFGVAEMCKKGHVITTMIEHPAVFEAVKKLEKKGFETTFLKPSKSGIISATQVKKALKPNTILVSIMYANNEIGTVQPIVEIAKVIRNFRKVISYQPSAVSQKTYPLFHTDACQATSYLNMDVKKLGVDLLTLNGSKIYGPKGIGVLFKKEGIEIAPQIIGGEQENGYRAGTENVASIVGLARAVELVSKAESKKEQTIREFLIKELGKIEGVSFNGNLKKRLPNNINFSVSGVEGESILLDLDRQGIEVSTGSACSSRSLEPSRVIAQIADDKTAHESIRVTLGRFTTKGEIDIFLKVLKKTIKRFQLMSPYGRS